MEIGHAGQGRTGRAGLGAEGRSVCRTRRRCESITGHPPELARQAKFPFAMARPAATHPAALASTRACTVCEAVGHRNTASSILSIFTWPPTRAAGRVCGHARVRSCCSTRLPRAPQHAAARCRRSFQFPVRHPRRLLSRRQSGLAQSFGEAERRKSSRPPLKVFQYLRSAA